MAEWLRKLIFSALISIACYLTTGGSSPSRVTNETSQTVLAGRQVVFLLDLLFLLFLKSVWLKRSEIILTGHKIQMSQAMRICVLCHM